MIYFLRFVSCSIMPVVMLLATGCGYPQLERVPVAGQVTVRGRPMKYGSISFRPAADVAGPAAGTDVVSGEYSISHQAGPSTGSYVAHITIVEGPSSKHAFTGKSGKVTTFKFPVDIDRDRKGYDFELQSGKR